MKHTFSKRLDAFSEGIFSVLNEKKDEMIKQGKTVYNLSVGTPDFKPQPHVMDALINAAKDPENYKYSLADMPELLEAVSEFYQKRFGVEVDTSEIMSLYGSQEGITHISFALTDPGDLVLVPNPGYPIFSIGPEICNARTYEYTLYSEEGFLPRLSEIPEEVLMEAKYMIVSYPLNPVCTVAPDSFYEELIQYARKYHFIVLHDNAYSDIIYQGRIGKSFLSYEGAKEVGIEFYSLSKSYNLTGARISFAVGNREIIKQFRTIRTQFDYGIFKPIQYAAIAALTGPQDAILAQREEYEARNQALCGGLRSIGWQVPDSQGTMFVWAPIPEGYESSQQFCLDLMEKAGVIVVPGTAFGSKGEGYVRLALVKPVEEMKEIVKVIGDTMNFNK